MGNWIVISHDFGFGDLSHSQLERDVTTTKEILRLPPVSAIFDRMQAEKRAQEREALAKACEEARSLMQLGVDSRRKACEASSRQR